MSNESVTKVKTVLNGSRRKKKQNHELEKLKLEVEMKEKEQERQHKIDIGQMKIEVEKQKLRAQTKKGTQLEKINIDELNIKTGRKLGSETIEREIVKLERNAFIHLVMEKI